MIAVAWSTASNLSSSFLMSAVYAAANTGVMKGPVPVALTVPWSLTRPPSDVARPAVRRMFVRSAEAA
jgi:hypothetical protein